MKQSILTPEQEFLARERLGEALGATEQYCDESGGKPGEDNTTHHLVPRSAGRGAQVMKCRYCGTTQAKIEARAGQENA